MSLLGPDDFGLGRKGRAKKLAKDLSPALQKTIEQWLDDEVSDDVMFERLSAALGPDRAKKIMAKKRLKGRPTKSKDPLREE